MLGNNNRIRCDGRAPWMDEKRGRVGDLQAVAEENAGDPTITSSAWASIDGDSAVPRSLAVFRIDGRLEFGRLHDRNSDGLAPR